MSRFSEGNAHYTDNLHIQKFRFDRQFTTHNGEIKANRTHWAVGGKLKKEETEEVAWMAKEQKLKPIIRPIRMRWFFKYKRTNQDPDNIESQKKVIMDGLVQAGILPNDSVKWIQGYDQTEFLKSEEEGGEVHFYEV